MTTATPDPLLAPWFEHLRGALPGLDLLDVHTHIGRNDPDGFAQAPAELLERLLAAGARAAVFPMQEPGGYPTANDAVLEAAASSSTWRGGARPTCSPSSPTSPRGRSSSRAMPRTARRPRARCSCCAARCRPA